MSSEELHRAAKRGDVETARRLVSEGGVDMNAYDSRGRTPLMHAVVSVAADADFVRLLLGHGARVDLENVGGEHEIKRGALAFALNSGNPEKVAALLEAGADIRYSRKEGYDALIDAVPGRGYRDGARLLDLLRLLVAKGAPLSGISSYKESALRILSRVGRFDGVRLLLDAGSDESQLGWTPLIRAVALGTLDDVKVASAGANLEEKDWWERTAWLVAILAGDIDKASFLLERGADRDARGRCSHTPLEYAVAGRHLPMLRWLLERGQDVEQVDEFGQTPLMTAAEGGDAAMIDALLAAGADVDRMREHDQSALSNCCSRDAALRLLEAGANPSYLSREARRAILGLPPEPELELLDSSPEEFQRARGTRFGAANPEEMDEPFWRAMIRAGVNAYQPRRLYEGGRIGGGPIWCADRFGQSLTFLPDGRIVEIGGEHEDSYDPDFCIYNDVIVHAAAGSVRIFGYPEEVFPPTDFHTATLAGDFIYVIGSLGYHGTRRPGFTPVRRLDTKSFRIETLQPSGEPPGWLSSHRAVLTAPGRIRIFGGEITTITGGKETNLKNTKSFILDIERMAWIPDPSEAP
jgi:ankyrin repeat protein